MHDLAEISLAEGLLSIVSIPPSFLLDEAIFPLNTTPYNYVPTPTKNIEGKSKDRSPPRIPISQEFNNLEISFDF